MLAELREVPSLQPPVEGTAKILTTLLVFTLHQMRSRQPHHFVFHSSPPRMNRPLINTSTMSARHSLPYTIKTPPCVSLLASSTCTSWPLPTCTMEYLQQPSARLIDESRSSTGSMPI